jgi:hypothetical protein
MDSVQTREWRLVRAIVKRRLEMSVELLAQGDRHNVEVALYPANQEKKKNDPVHPQTEGDLPSFPLPPKTSG